MVSLFAAPPAWGLPNILPATMKLETWLRMAGIAYQIEPADLGRAPKGKLPYVSLDGELVGDSTLVVERLSRELAKDTDRGLSAKEKAVSLAFRRLMKENFYWVLIVDRWGNEENFAVYEPVLCRLFFSALPPDQQRANVAAYRKLILEQAKAQGMARHTIDEVHSIGVADVSACSDWLGDKPFFMGDEPTTVDATLYAYLANVLCVPMRSKVRDHGRALPNILPYLDRMQARFFSEMGTPSAHG